jgi:hypothetical protein
MLPIVERNGYLVCVCGMVSLQPSANEANEGTIEPKARLRMVGAAQTWRTPMKGEWDKEEEGRKERVEKEIVLILNTY